MTSQTTHQSNPGANLNKKNKRVLTIQGPAGDLELRLQQHSAQHAVEDMSQRPKKGLVVVSHPHPLYGGTMDNKVVTTMERAFYKLGFDTLAYNFRGVGKSQGEYDEGVGETEDLTAVVNWAHQQTDYEKTVLAGFSFGSYVSLKAQQQCQLDGLCIIAPPVGLYDFSGFKEMKTPWILIQGGADEVIDAQEVMQWVNQQNHRPDIYWREHASHFFHGELVWLRKIIEAHYS